MMSGWRKMAIEAALPAAIVLSLGSCAMHPQWHEASAETVREQKLEGLPYHPLVYHLDLCVLSYQIYGQSLVWPIDPYYEEVAGIKGARNGQMARVRSWATATGQRQARESTRLSHYRGPGVLGGFSDNPAHDPIIYRYDQLHPWNPTITNADGRWTEYLTPDEITRGIGSVYVVCRKIGGQAHEVVMRRVPVRGRGPGPGARDVLLAFEGGTGDKGEPGQTASQSLMGFVLLRHAGGGGVYDVHIVFRGSRCGSAVRALFQALGTENARGNPDWITDLGHRHLLPSEGGAHISTVGKVSRGFATSMESILPTVFRCLQEVDRSKGGRPPRNVYVTGHSLGGALAQHFVSAVFLGDRFGPDGSGPSMPRALRDWPWKELKLITYGSPRAGDGIWARALSEGKLGSEPYLAIADPYDRKALPVAHPNVIPRLTNPARPAGYRVLFSMDPVTTNGIIGGNHVGRSVYVNDPGLLDGIMLWSFDSHEPALLRDRMLERLADARIPPVAWKYRELRELDPGRNPDAMGSAEELGRLQDAYDRYHRERGLSYDAGASRREFERFLSTLDGG